MNVLPKVFWRSRNVFLVSILNAFADWNTGSPTLNLVLTVEEIPET